MKKIYLAASAAALLAACSSMGMGGGMDHAGMNHGGGGDAGMAAADMAGMPRDAMGYVAMAGASDLYEIQSSQIALQRTQNPELRQFAQMLITDHTRTTEQVTAAAREAGMTPPPPQLDAQKTQMIQELQSATDFDRTFVMQQVAAHQQALALHQNYAQNGDAPPLRRVATTAVPIIRGHLERVQRMPGASGG